MIHETMATQLAAKSIEAESKDMDMPLQDTKRGFDVESLSNAIVGNHEETNKGIVTEKGSATALSDRDKTDQVLVQMILELVAILDPSARGPVSQPTPPTVRSIKSTAISLSASGLALQVAYEGVYVVGIDKMSDDEATTGLNARLKNHVNQIQVDIAKVMPLRIGNNMVRGAPGTNISVDVVSSLGKLIATGMQNPRRAKMKARMKEKGEATTIKLGNVGSTCFVVVTSPGKATYDGEVNLRGQFNGFGACVSFKAYSYVGWWKNGMRDFWGLENDAAQFYVVQYGEGRVIERIPILPCRSLLLPIKELDEACQRCFQHPTAHELNSLGAIKLERFRTRFERVKVARRIMASVHLPEETFRRLDFGLARLLTSEMDTFIVALWRHLIPSFEGMDSSSKDSPSSSKPASPSPSKPTSPSKSKITTTFTTASGTTTTTTKTHGPSSFDLPFVVKCSLSQAFWPIRNARPPSSPAKTCGVHGNDKFMNDFRDIVPSIGEVTPAAREFSAAMVMFACLLDFIQGRSAAKEALKATAGKRPPTNLGMIYPLVCQVLRACVVRGAMVGSASNGTKKVASESEKRSESDLTKPKDLANVIDFLSSSTMLTSAEVSTTLQALSTPLSRSQSPRHALPFYRNYKEGKRTSRRRKSLPSNRRTRNRKNVKHAIVQIRSCVANAVLIFDIVMSIAKSPTGQYINKRARVG